jgi:Na+-translocating ferredoxin:NAD+ oxidoreductase subunit B
MPMIVEKDKCEGCGTCMGVCTKGAINLVELDGKMIAEIAPEQCEECGDCIQFCLRGAISQS